MFELVSIRGFRCLVFCFRYNATVSDCITWLVRGLTE